MEKDIYGQALLDYAAGQEKKLSLETSYGTIEEMPVSHYFREYDGLPDTEVIALQFCTGKILDAGAGAGVHAMILQKNGNDVTAVEISPGACEVMKNAGIQKVKNVDFRTLTNQSFDRVLFLMNGLGLAGTLDNLVPFLKQAAALLADGGEILADSSDINYLYENEGVDYPEGYYGNLAYRYLYDGKKGEWFPWLYVDADTLAEHANRAGLECNIVFTDENDQYLARLYRK